MPYRWTEETAPDDSGAVSHRLVLWPHRSLPRRGFVWFIGATMALVSLPLIAVIGTAALWPLLVFVAIAVAGVWFALHLTYRSGHVHEVLRFDARNLSLVRRDPGPCRARLDGQQLLGARADPPRPGRKLSGADGRAART